MPPLGEFVPQRVLLCHAYYRQRGGEDESFEAEARLLENRGHAVFKYTFDNRDTSSWSTVQLATKGFWNQRVFKDVRAFIQSQNIQIVHCTNLFPFMSTSVYYAARKEKVPVVQALRNYRSTCVNSLLMRENKVCLDCVGSKLAWHGIQHGCYRNSHLASAIVAIQSAVQQRIGVQHSLVDWYFAPSQIARDIQIRAGIPEQRISVKPNFIDPPPQVGRGSGDYVLFVGRLSEEKGVRTLLQAWKQDSTLPKLKICGDGPLHSMVRAAGQSDARIQWLGQVDQARVLEEVSEAKCLVIPSIWYETFGRTMMESLATGTPIVASRLGAMEELVNETTGVLFEPGNSTAMASAVHKLIGASVERVAQYRAEARALFLREFTGGKNYGQLMEIYNSAKRVANSRARTILRPTWRIADSDGRGVLP